MASNRTPAVVSAPASNSGADTSHQIELVRDTFKGNDLLIFIDRSRPVDRFALQFGRAKAARLVAYAKANGRGSLERLLEEFVNEQSAD